MPCRKLRQIFQYHVSNKVLSLKKFAHHVLVFFYPFRDEKELLSSSSNVSKPVVREKSLKHNELWTIWWFSWSGFFAF